MYRVTAWTHKLHYIPLVAQLPLNLITLTLFWFLITGSSSIQAKKLPLFPGFPPSSFRLLTVCKNGREGLGESVMWMMSMSTYM